MLYKIRYNYIIIFYKKIETNVYILYIIICILKRYLHEKYLILNSFL